MASASGLVNITRSDWDDEILGALDVDRKQLPPLASLTDIVGNLTPDAATEFGLKAGVPVILGSGDGFLSNIGSDCEQPHKIAVSLGTSAVARQMMNRPVLDSSFGTFCYLSDKASYLLGCAGSNGGNVLDWGRRIFGELRDGEASEPPPIFIPLLNGERSPDWNPNLTGSWHGLTSRHTSADLGRSILEGVIFNLAQFVEIVQRASGEQIECVVLSGNGFLQAAAAPILAGIVGIPTRRLQPPGLASLRGAGVCALRALSQPVPPPDLETVSPVTDPQISQRYADYRRLRRGGPSPGGRGL
jgi:gluconokinase